MRGMLAGAAFVVCVLLCAGPGLRALNRATASADPCANPQPVPSALRLPGTLPPGEPNDVERTMLGFLSSYGYRDLGWCYDKGVRDTGPYLNHVSYGTHPAVRIYYSPEMMEWLRGGRRGVPRDGAVIIKEQYGDKPAVFFRGKSPADLQPTDWTIMVRRSSSSHDGWFWAEVYAGMFDAPRAPATRYPNAGFGLYCLRCHASAQRALTFASLENVAGYPGEPIHYKVDDSWQTVATAAPGAAVIPPSAPVRPLPVQTFPPEPLDTYVAHAHVPHLFITSDQCMGCHSAAPKKPFGPTMWVAGRNVSEYGEWRWSPMALSGRDPVFYAQLESEMHYLGTLQRGRAQRLQQQISDTCMNCHGVMGKRAFAADHPLAKFSPQFVFDANPAHIGFHYGGLARDGISCTVCHRMVPSTAPPRQASLAYFLNNKINGRFDLGAAPQLYGPFKDNAIVTHAMTEALGMKPRYAPFVSSSRLCASCHTIKLPVIDKLAPQTPAAQHHNIEQATYLEWVNSKYQTDYYPGPGAKSCQDCHMPALTHVATRIALVQDATYPQTTNAASPADLNVRLRASGFRRHELLGLNAFLLSLFRQYPSTMGVRTSDYMSGSAAGLDAAIANIMLQARTATARLRVRASMRGRLLIADVETINLTGHRFPSGVGFRRAFLDVEVRDALAPSGDPPLFASGRTDSLGRIVGSAGMPLPSETFARGASGGQRYQDHFDEAHPVTNADQAQVFEELMRDGDGAFTTSFIRRERETKDNRLLPAGWTKTGPAGALPQAFLHATFPSGLAASDPRYADGLGHAITRYTIRVPAGIDPKNVRVTATLYYQSWAPYFLQMREAGTGPAARRFAALVEHLDLRGTPLQGWKIRVAQTQPVIPRR